jgi:predicted metal-binding membrane protein
MTSVDLLTNIGLLRLARRPAFCPACKGWLGSEEASRAVTPRELAPPAVVAAVVLVLALGAWIAVIEQARAMGDMGDMPMGLGSPGSFAAGWLLMMSAMMLPTTLPLVFEFARRAERRAGWQVATSLLLATYLGVWLVFGVVVYLGYVALHMPWPDQRLIGGVALVLAGLYALTPLKRASEARCRELCALHGPLPFNLQRSAVLVGARYGLSCIGCSAALMISTVLIGMSGLAWMAVLSGLVLLYKMAPVSGGWHRTVLAVAVAALGVLYAKGG